MDEMQTPEWIKQLKALLNDYKKDILRQHSLEEIYQLLDNDTRRTGQSQQNIKSKK